MKRVFRMFDVPTFQKDESGATAIEYGLIGSLISIAIIGAASSLGTAISAQMGVIATAINRH
jgi:pilus assembly protein Flp/PilA